MINFNKYEEDDYYLYPFAGNIEFARKRKPMAAAVKKKISTALKGRGRRKGRGKNAKRAAIGTGAVLGAAGLVAGGKKLRNHMQTRALDKREFDKLREDVSHAAGQGMRAGQEGSGVTRNDAKEAWSRLVPKNITKRR